MTVPCGQCIGCKLDRSRSWALRCAHEAEFHDQNSFITLTYATEPFGGSLKPMDVTLFMKRLRRKLAKPVKFFMCGEYGSVRDENGQIIPGELGRPHYHILLFGHDFEDKLFFKKSNTGFPIYTSELLTERWGLGHAVTQAFSIEAAAYVARYCTKKITGPKAEDHYQKEFVTNDGEIIRIQVEPEYNRMSNREAIGKKWFSNYHSDVYPKDFVTNKGIKFRPPRYYDKLFEDLEPEAMAQIKETRLEHARQNAVPAKRLSQIGKVKELQAKRLVRPL